MLPFFYLFVFVPCYLFCEGLVLKTLWGWFVVEAFDVRPLTITQAAGIALMVALLVYTVDHGAPGRADEERDTRMHTSMVQQVAMLVMVFVTAWALHRIGR